MYTDHPVLFYDGLQWGTIKEDCGSRGRPSEHDSHHMKTLVKEMHAIIREMSQVKVVNI